ncbi:MAG: copper transporter [Solirubrobacterales bacterium]|nr:copper transporter [Solirubrobacterales bacterium]MCB0859912.1 copper transporter [Solirubrobacterales bacterium]
MGYSARYHAASLAAVFLALAIGILIGSQWGSDVLNKTRKDLESSLTSDLNDARANIDDLNRQLDQSNQFGGTVFPLLTEGRLGNRKVGLVGFGDLPSSVTDAVEKALEPTGAELVAVGAVRQPPSTEDLATALQGTRFRKVANNEEKLSAYGRTIGRQLVTGGRILNMTRSELMSQSSGQFAGLNGLIFYRAEPGDVEPSVQETADQLDLSIIQGADSTRARLVGIETVATDPSTISFLRDRNLTTVDNLDQPAGKVSLVYALNGADGAFGVKGEATRLLPELLKPVGGSGSGQQGSGGGQAGDEQGRAEP